MPRTRRTGVELEAVRALDPPDPLTFEVGVEGTDRAAVRVGDEDPDVAAVAFADLGDLGRHGLR